MLEVSDSMPLISRLLLYAALYRADYCIVQCRTMHELSVTYHFTSPWENHHLAASLRLLLRPEHAYFAVSIPLMQV